MADEGNQGAVVDTQHIVLLHKLGRPPDAQFELVKTAIRDLLAL